MTIDQFKGEHAFLSNFHMQSFEFDGHTWPSAEHAYQAMKTEDEVERSKFRRPDVTAAQAKKMGRRLKVREGWDDIKVSVMSSIVEAKFADKAMTTQLLLTGDHELIEGNWWGDTFWGVCKGRGANELGRILMNVRARLKDTFKSNT